MESARVVLKLLDVTGLEIRDGPCASRLFVRLQLGQYTLCSKALPFSAHPTWNEEFDLETSGAASDQKLVLSLLEVRSDCYEERALAQFQVSLSSIPRISPAFLVLEALPDERAPPPAAAGSPVKLCVALVNRKPSNSRPSISKTVGQWVASLPGHSPAIPTPSSRNSSVTLSAPAGHRGGRSSNPPSPHPLIAYPRLGASKAPDGKLQVTVIRARGVPTRLARAACHLDLRLGEQHVVTSSLPCGSFPEWNETFSFVVAHPEKAFLHTPPLEMMLWISIMDSDGLPESYRLCSFELDLCRLFKGVRQELWLNPSAVFACSEISFACQGPGSSSSMSRAEAAAPLWEGTSVLLLLTTRDIPEHFCDSVLQQESNARVSILSMEANARQDLSLAFLIPEGCPRLGVKIFAAKNLPEASEADTLCFFVLAVGSTRQSTSCIPYSTHPAWDKRFTFPVEGSAEGGRL
eukprot:RCo020789